MIDSINTVNQADYMTLFMQELTYQDPLKPVDNREFMAQMAQFSALQQAQVGNDHLAQLVGMTTANQSLLLLGKQVKINGSEQLGQVKEIEFSANEPPKIKININGGIVTKGLNDIVAVQ